MTVLGLVSSCLAAWVAFAVFKVVLSGLSNPLSHLPGPWHTRYTGLASHFHRLRGTKTGWTHAMLSKYGPIVRLEPDQVATADPNIWEEMNRMGTPFRKTQFHEKMRVGPDHMLFSITDARQHSSRRRLFARALTMDALRKNWEAQVRSKVELCIDQIRAQAQSGVADVVKWFRLMAGDTVALLSFGQSFGLIESGGSSESEYFRALEDVGVNIVLKDIVPFLPLLAPLLPWKRLREIFNANQLITDKGTVAVNNLRDKRLDRPNLFTNMLAAAEKDEGNLLTDNAIRSEAAGFLIAGSDTTGAAMVYVIWAVLKRPELQKRLEAEVAALPPGFTDQDLEQLRLMNNVIDEALRLYNPASGTILRRMPSPGATWHGYYIPADTNILTQQWTFVRDQKLFTDAERFDETRFDHATDRQRRVAQPFGLGTRSCIGIHLAKMEMRLATALFFRKCKGARLGMDMTDDMMQQLMKFFTYPKGNRCDITLCDNK